MFKTMMITTTILMGLGCSAHAAEPKFVFRYNTGAVKTISVTPETPIIPEVPEMPEREIPETPAYKPENLVINELSASFRNSQLTEKVVLTNPNDFGAYVTVMIEAYGDVYGDGTTIRMSHSYPNCFVPAKTTKDCGGTRYAGGVTKMMIFVDDYTVNKVKVVVGKQVEIDV